VSLDPDGRITVFVAAHYETLLLKEARAYRDELTLAIEHAERTSNSLPNLELFASNDGES
jgi:tRNA isopentenyl-2-thiomethyl-A-37 hydroxylase MiaE